jgi:hypothetical protein
MSCEDTIRSGKADSLLAPVEGRLPGNSFLPAPFISFMKG